MRYGPRNSNTILILIALNVLVFIGTSLSDQLFRSLALTKPITDSDYWTVFTAMFVHANFTHILFNMITLYFFGTFCLQLIGEKWFLIAYFVGGLFGNILYLLIGPQFSIVVGASGAIYALGGVLVMMRPTLRVYLYFFIPMPLWVVIIIGFLLTSFGGNIAWEAHLGGLIVGLIIGYYFRRRERRPANRPYYRY